MNLFSFLCAAVGIAIVPIAFADGAALQPRRADQESFIAQAVFAEGKLWLRSDAGTVSSIKEGEGKRKEITTPQPVLGLWRNQSVPWIIACSSSDCREWTLAKHNGGKFSAFAKLPTQGDELVAASGADDNVVVLTTRRLISLGTGSQTIVSLSAPLRQAPMRTILVTPEAIFVGLNIGEWGGGMSRIDRRTGKVSAVGCSQSDADCDGPIVADVDPVNGIAVEPWQRNCVAAAVGLVHMLSHGRVVEICGDRVRQVYSATFATPVGADKTTVAWLKEVSVPFFSLEACGADLCAVATDGIHRIGRDGGVRVAELPEFAEIGGVGVSFRHPDFVLVATRVNQRVSVSGAVPILVPRN
ncbi:MAG: hypothetical protein JSS42_15785 [Proteobacteria bacterium]|nr:hypothetical protein [Pseudomonadota bacterium]